MLFKSLSHYQDFGMLFLRLGIGLNYVFIHGLPKLMGGVERWEGVGQAMGAVGMDFYPVFWGFMAAFSEFAGGILLILGFMYRPALMLLLISMVVATALQIESGKDLGPYVSHPLKMAILFFALLFISPGKYSIDKQ